jgi:hypothetical protein
MRCVWHHHLTAWERDVDDLAYMGEEALPMLRVEGCHIAFASFFCDPSITGGLSIPLDYDLASLFEQSGSCDWLVRPATVSGVSLLTGVHG